MKESLGIIEVVGLANAVVIADAMAKTANINISNTEITKGMGYMTIKILGDIAAVKAAISSGKMLAVTNNSYVSSIIIARPTDATNLLFAKNLQEEKVEKKEIEVEVIEEVEEKIEEVKEIKEEIKIEIKNDKKSNKKSKK